MGVRFLSCDFILFFPPPSCFAGQSSKQGAFAEDNLVFSLLKTPSICISQCLAYFVHAIRRRWYYKEREIFLWKSSNRLRSMISRCDTWNCIFISSSRPSSKWSAPLIFFFLSFFDTKPMWLLPDMGLNVNVNAWGTKSITTSHHKQKQRASVWHFGPCTFCPPKRWTNPPALGPGPKRTGAQRRLLHCVLWGGFLLTLLGLSTPLNHAAV